MRLSHFSTAPKGGDASLFSSKKTSSGIVRRNGRHTFLYTPSLSLSPTLVQEDIFCFMREKKVPSLHGDRTHYSLLVYCSSQWKWWGNQFTLEFWQKEKTGKEDWIFPVQAISEDAGKHQRHIIEWARASSPLRSLFVNMLSSCTYLQCSINAIRRLLRKYVTSKQASAESHAEQPVCLRSSKLSPWRGSLGSP